MGGEKSDALVMEATRQVHIPYYRGLIVRRTYPQLEDLIGRSLRLYPHAFPGAKYNDSKHIWHFPSGAVIIFGSIQHEKDKYNYQGKPYDFIGFDELTQFTYSLYDYLAHSRCRPNGPGTRTYVRATANPGGIGHGKQYSSIQKLSSAIDSAGLTSSQKQALAKKFALYGFGVDLS